MASSIGKLPPAAVPLKGETKDPDAQIRNVAKLYEKQFLREMVKAMRQTVSESGLTKADAGRALYQEQLDQEYVEKWGDQGGIGLSEMIYNQLKDRYGAQLGLIKDIEKPSGPIPLDAKSNVQAHIRTAKSPDSPINVRLSMDAKAQPQDVSTPWDGLLMKKFSVDDKNILELRHENGLTSQLVFAGQPRDLKLNQRIQAGESLGLLSPDQRSVYWEIRKQKIPVFAESELSQNHL